MISLRKNILWQLTIQCLISVVFVSYVSSASIHHTSQAKGNVPIIGELALQQTITGIISTADFTHTNIGISVVNLDNGETIIAHQAHQLFHPASTMKLYTTAAALTYLRASHRFTTQVGIGPSTLSKGVIRGNLWLRGTGDMTLTDQDLLKMAESLSCLGVTTITGNLICDDFAFDDIRYGKGWMWDDQPYKDFAPIGALSVNRNTVKVFVQPGSTIHSSATIRIAPSTRFIDIINTTKTVASGTVIDEDHNVNVLRRLQTQENILEANGNIEVNSQELEFSRNILFPAIYTGSVFKEALNSKGINLQGSITRGTTPSDIAIIAQHTSEPLQTIIATMNKNSHNHDAELLLKAIGRAQQGGKGTDEKGFAAIIHFLEINGIDTSAVRFADGSGVSRYNLTTPTNIAALLRAIHNNFKIRNDFISSLAIAGVDGDLEDRMTNTTAASHVSAKSGAMTGVSNLAGYARSMDGSRLAFAIMIEHFIGSHRPFHLAQDKICDALCRYQPQ